MKLANQEALNKAQGPQMGGYVDSEFMSYNILTCGYGMPPVHVSREAIEY